MFKPARILQAAVLVTFLGGCATTKTAAISPAPAQAPAPVNTAGASLPPHIKAGNSTSSTEGFVDARGQLKPDIQAYAREVAQTRHVPLNRIEVLLKSARYNATVARLMTPGKTRIRRSWVTYRKRFVEPIRIKAGAAFWSEHRAALDQAARQYGVPQSIIVAIIGVETIYGRQTGDFPVLDALATLGFRHPDGARPERSQMFRDQLADLIQLDHEKKLDALEVEGSFAGAIGLPQFMPGSILRYAVDGDASGHIDLTNSPRDAILSVANFLRQHGWVPGLPVFAPVVLPGNAGTLVAGGLTPNYSWPELDAKGASIRPGSVNTAWEKYPVGVVDLIDEPRNLNEYRTGTPNFFAITHYNHSYFYAASVADLAQAIAERIGSSAL
ncbi:lytic murein transglycosylase B [Paralcaligenes sp. KSB-10]|uniref:lytic murein transglycosylase B n=1 Tax=Paralcaligenes sp. KSB-10 TaxID=2901142 RepID=UPI001E617752|nr:lytic murein transglycosylase B [Paralcaligenes sp. KSB-10]UHL65172.1 lytic murein transglycosylase B [Paralcaligenes sp. KSB-10]